MWKVFYSLRYRIIFSIVIIEVVMLSIMVWANTAEVKRTHAARLVESAHLILQQFTTTVGRYIIEADYASLEEYAGAVIKHDELDYIIVEDITGRELLSVGTVPAARQLNEGPTASADGVFDVSRKILFGEKVRGAVHMGFSLALMQRTTRDALRRGMAIATIEVILSIFAALLLGHALTRNLKFLSSGVERFSRGESDVAVPIRGRDEIARLGAAFNTMVRDRARNEAALRDSEARLQRLLDSMAEAVYGLDTDGNCTFCNASCLRLLGYHEPGELLGRNLHQLIHHTRPDGTPYPDRECRIYHAFRHGQGVEVDDEVLWRHDGSSFAAEYRSFPVTRDGEVIGAVVTFTDITERKQAEDQLRQAQKMEVVGQLTGGMAHDFNNLLAVIMGNLQLIGADLKEDLPSRRHIAGALRAVRRGRDLTHRLLAFSRRQALVPEATDPNAMIGGMIGLLKRTLGETIEIETVLAEDIWPAIVDRSQLETALLNLAVNARDAMPEGGRLTIETARARLERDYAARHEEVVAGDYAMIAVSDSGTGMPAEVASRVFEPFFTTKAVGMGTGLGLSMVYGFVKQSGGHVKIYSEPGRGTTVRLYLPRARTVAEPDQARPDLGAEPRGQGERVLVVEDQPAVRDITVALLERLGYRVVAVGDGKAALAQLREASTFDLLFTDVVLPGGMGGEELARHARALVPRIPVLFATGYTANAALRNGALSETAAVLAKPFEKNVLAQRMREILDRRPEAAQVAHPPAEPGAQSSGQTPNEPEAPASEFRGVILIVDDDPAVLDSTAGLLRGLGYRVLQASDGEQALALLERAPGVKLMLTDLRLQGGMSGAELAKQALRRCPGLKLLYVSGGPGPGAGHGIAENFIAKPYDAQRLDRRIQGLIGRIASRRDDSKNHP